MILSAITYVRVAILLLLGIPFIYGGVVFFTNFPRSYTWSELVINYQGGFIRRGLIGEVAFQLNGVIQARYFLSILPTVLYFLVIWFIVCREKKIDFKSLIFLLSPATILFPVYDFNAFARKDVFILAAFVLCVYLSERIRSLNLALILAMLIYGVTGLVVETAWFYLPLACAVIILNRKGEIIENQARAWYLSFFFLLTCFIFISLTNSSNVSKITIIDSWRLLYPSYQWDWNGKGAIGLLGLPLNEGLLITFYSVCYRTTIEGYVCSFLLASIPAFFLMLNFKWRRFCKISKLGIAWSLTVMFCSFAFAADWGRCIYLFTMHSYLFLTVISNSSEQGDQEGKVAAKTKNCFAIKALFVVVYATVWQVQHWVPGGQNALRPGVLIILIRKLSALALQY